MKLSAYLSLSRHGIFYFRWPLPHTDNNCRPNIKVSLRTRCPVRAGTLARYLASCGEFTRDNKDLARLRQDKLRELVQSYFHAQLNQYLEWIGNRGLTASVLSHARSEMLDHEDHIDRGRLTTQYLPIERFKRMSGLSDEDWFDSLPQAVTELRKGRRDMLREVLEAAEGLERYSYELRSPVPFTATAPSATPAVGPATLGKLDGKPVDEIHSDLTANLLGFNLTKASLLPENVGYCFEGMKKYGEFDVPGDTARDWLTQPLNVNGRPNSDVIFPLIVAIDLVRRPMDRWVIDFGTHPTLEGAALYERPFHHISTFVYPYRQTVRRERTKARWWVFEEARVALRKRLHGLPRYIGTPRVSKHRIFVWLDASAKPDTAIDAIARDDDTTFGMLHSRFHELWSLRMGTSLEDRPRHTPSTTFETFPFPNGPTPNIPAATYASDSRAVKIAAAASRLNELRENWLNPPDLVKRVPEVVAGYPDRILPVSPEAAAALKKRTLTNLYNTRPAWLDHAHKALDEAVAEAYGWGDDWRAGLLTDDEILARLFRLNQERAADQQKNTNRRSL